MKKMYIFFFALILLFVLGCNKIHKTSEIVNETTEDKPSVTEYMTIEERHTDVPNTDPDVPDDFKEPDMVDNHIEMESNYDNIIFEVEEDEYSLNCEQVRAVFTNKRKDVAFRAYRYPFLEKKVGSKWVRVPYYRDGMFNDGMDWVYVMSPDQSGINYSFTIDLFTENVYAELTPGKYRLVGFAGDKKYYGEFEFAE